MVVTDMDGTLLNSKHEVSSEFFELFEQLKKHNIHFVAASGRQYHSILEKLKTIKDDITIIAENGGYAVQENKELFSTPLTQPDKEEILRVLKNIDGIHPVLCGKNNAYLTGKSDTFTNKLKEFYTEFELLADLENHIGEILKIAIFHFESSEQFIYPKVKHLEEKLKVKVSGKNWLDISSTNANKGYALQKIMDLHKITAEEVLVFGDYNNDLEMLSLAKYSVAMANAHLNVKKTANYETSSNDEYGVERILRKLISAKTNA